MTYTDNKIFIVELRSVKCVSVMEKKKKKKRLLVGAGNLPQTPTGRHTGAQHTRT